MSILFFNNYLLYGPHVFSKTNSQSDPLFIILPSPTPRDYGAGETAFRPGQEFILQQWKMVPAVSFPQ